MKKRAAKLFSDGACRGNPGIGGAGAVVTDEADRVLWEGKEYLGLCTNNIAEYKALILGLKGALEKKIHHLDVYLDSELLARQINGIYKVKHPDLKVLMDEVRSLLSLFHSVSVQHVPRCHNAQADRLANQAIDEYKG
jgi:ribonuclease HI/probable phosphoglycerate mutase